MAAVRVLVLFFLFFSCLKIGAADGLTAEDVFDILSRRLNTVVQEIVSVKSELKRDVKRIEKRIETIGTNVSDMTTLYYNVKKDEEISNIPDELEVQTKALKEMFASEKSNLKETIAKFQNMYSEFQSDINSQLTLLNLSFGNAKENLERTVYDHKTDTNATVLELMNGQDNGTNETSTDIGELSSDSLKLINELEASITANVKSDVESAKSEISATLNSEISKLTSKLTALERKQDSHADTYPGPAAHLMGSIRKQQQPTVPGRMFPISHWISDEDLAFINGVQYRHGRIIIHKEGFYYVYSQVSFLEVYGDSDNGETESLTHYIYRYNIVYPHGGEESMMENSITKCWGQNKAFGEYTSYLGAVFHLRLGDEMFVKVSDLNLIKREPKVNSFGLFKIN